VISYITPTHNPKYLPEVYESLKAQTNQDWEWIIVPNGKITKTDITDVIGIVFDRRIKIRYLPKELEGKGIGAIKRWSFREAAGDYLAELDHDDLLASNATEEIEKAFKESGADFVYSNCADFFPDGSGHWFPNWQANGWRYRDTEVDGKRVNECISFAPTANSLSLIYYAPNHIRCWRKNFYNEIGGHNPALALCDDQELLIRTYLQGTMHHIDKPLYRYRLGEQNTFSKKLDEIREITCGLYTQYVERLILREAELKSLPCYDLGGAFSCPDGWRSVDIRNADICCDLNKEWPLKDNSVLAFRAFDIFEHLKDKQHVMSEVSRCLVNGGYLHAQIPCALGNGAYMDPTHISYWVEQSFWYYTRAEQAKYIRNRKENFIEQRLFTFFPSDWHKQNNISYVKAELINIKNGREGIPGVLQM
jgi:glycosyltransferase involved in cell wall biosynthesis